MNEFSVKHTPGPWYLSPPEDGEGLLIKPIPGQVVAEIDPTPEMEANATLIAAAPELLKALEYCLMKAEATQMTKAEKLQQIGDIARKSIQKATTIPGLLSAIKEDRTPDIKIRDFIKVADIGRETLLPETVRAIESYGPTYRDSEDIGEHLYRIDSVWQDRGDLLPSVAAEIEAIFHVLEDSDAVYIRFCKI